MKDYHDEPDGLNVDEFDPGDAAAIACDRWNDLGTFAGDPLPSVMEVYVRDLDTRDLFMVEVEPTYDVVFYGGTAKKVAEPTG
jgi:hypothetical protein